MAHQIYAIERRTAERASLCEVEEGVCYFVGERAAMTSQACKLNRASKRKHWGAKFRAVPIPYTTALPEWFEYSAAQ